ncbi:phosphomannomutase, partial [Propionivibrio soli]|uniref:phosphomannomutase n=1 Tax=Propionivibrio soli TaxID=2976531 RepID=UPI0021E8BFE5
MNSGRIALGIDLRPSSPRLAAACAAAIRHAGLDVDFGGALPTPALAYYAQESGCPAIMVTGSHIPFDRNGIKFYRREGEITKDDEAAITRAVVTVPEADLTVPLPPINAAATERYLARYLDFFPKGCLAGMRLGFYEHSSVARDLLRQLLERLGAEVVSLGRVDEFVPIDTEAVSDADIEQARQWAAKYHFDAILSTDGDADRPLLGDEHGRWLRGDIVGLLCAQALGATAVASTVSGNTALERCGAFPRIVRTRIGSPYVIAAIEGLIAEGVGPVVGFEPNGGFLVGTPIERHGKVLAPLLTRDAALPILTLLAEARARRQPLSELLRPLPARFTASDRLPDFPTEISRALVQQLASSDAVRRDLLGGLGAPVVKTDETDGLRLFLENGDIVHFRPSGNAPELRCYAESGSSEKATALVRDGLRRLA